MTSTTSVATLSPQSSPRVLDPTLTSVFSTASTPARPADPEALVLSVAQLRSLGVHPSTITKRCRPGGPWRRLATGVVLLDSGEPTRRQLLRAAVAYLGPEGVITGVDALRANGVRLSPPPQVQTLVAAGRRLTPPAFLAVERTARLPHPLIVDGLPYAPPARAVIDAARRETDPDRIRRLLTVAIEEGLCSLDDLRTELDQGSQRGSAVVRMQLRALTYTDTCALRRTARELARRCPLPPPRWDTDVLTRGRRLLGTVDAWWDDVGLGWSVLSPTSPDRLRPRNDRAGLALSAAGVVLVRTPSSMLRHHGDLVVAELVRAFRHAARRPRPPVLSEARPASWR